MTDNLQKLKDILATSPINREIFTEEGRIKADCPENFVKILDVLSEEEQFLAINWISDQYSESRDTIKDTALLAVIEALHSRNKNDCKYLSYTDSLKPHFLALLKPHFVALNNAICEGDTRTIESLLHRHGASLINTALDPENYHQAPLLIAIQQIQKFFWDHNRKGTAKEVVKLLVANGADVNPQAKSGFESTTSPLTMALYLKMLDIADLLVDAGANVQTSRKDHCTTFNLAIKLNGDYRDVQYMNFLKKLIIKGSPVDIEKDFCFVEPAKATIILTILNDVGLVRAWTAQGGAALHRALRENSSPMECALLQRPVNLEIVHVLFECGALLPDQARFADLIDKDTNIAELYRIDNCIRENLCTQELCGLLESLSINPFAFNRVLSIFVRQPLLLWNSLYNQNYPELDTPRTPQQIQARVRQFYARLEGFIDWCRNNMDQSALQTTTESEMFRNYLLHYSNAQAMLIALSDRIMENLADDIKLMIAKKIMAGNPHTRMAHQYHQWPAQQFHAERQRQVAQRQAAASAAAAEATARQTRREQLATAAEKRR